jgi:methylated-DNA-protein-cysteine methyltransferase-like protein
MGEDKGDSVYNRAMAKAKPANPMTPRIRETILKIPRGHVSTYGAIARAAGLPGGARQVVQTLGKSHGLPWHRVVAAGGRIAIPGEGGLDQRFRLEMEGVKFSGKKVRMAEFEFKFPRNRTTRRKATKQKKKSTVGRQKTANQREKRES